jgi:hypothetical protein
MNHRHWLTSLLFCVFLIGSWMIPRWAFGEAFVDAGGGTVCSRDPGETEVELVSETLRIYLYSEEYVADASFVFRNIGPMAHHQLGFPQFDYGTELVSKLRDFRTWVNGQPVRAVQIPSEPGSHPQIRSWFVKEVSFPQGVLTTTRVRYRSNYGRDRLLRTVEYLYGTGHTWRDSIGQIRVQVFNSDGIWVDAYSFVGNVNSAFFSLDGSDFEIITADVEPEAKDQFRLILERIPWWLSDAPCAPERDWIFDRIVVKEAYLRLLTLRQLRIFRNTFYARHGFDFGRGDLGRFFGQYRWYRPRTKGAEGLLTPIEQQNVELIVAEEQRRRTLLLNCRPH